MMNPSAPAAAPASGLGGWLTRAERWMDSKGRGAWIAAMVLGFIFLPPLGLALVFYITFTNRWSRTMFGHSCQKSHRFGHRHDRHMAEGQGRWGGDMSRHAAFRSTGNAAFDAYKADTLSRLEDEQTAFETFLDRLRTAKDKTEFDSFMEDRARAAQAPQGTDTNETRANEGPASPSGPVPHSY